VHFYGALSGWVPRRKEPYRGPFAATIVFVNDDGSVNLRVDYPSAVILRSGIAAAARADGWGVMVTDLSRTSEMVENVTNDPQSEKRWEWPPRA